MIAVKADSVDDIELKLLLEALYQTYHYDFREYAMASIKRRLSQARERFGCRSYSMLQDRLLRDATLLPRLLDYLTVQVSDMFRDPGYFGALRQQVVPYLKTYPFVKVWVAGCSTGRNSTRSRFCSEKRDSKTAPCSMPRTSMPNPCAGRRWGFMT